MKAEACGLALTLLSQHDVCPSCKWAASDHRGWQRELERGAIPSPGGVELVEPVELEAGAGVELEVSETVGPECFGGSDFDEYDEDEAARTLERSRVFVEKPSPSSPVPASSPEAPELERSPVSGLPGLRRALTSSHRKGSRPPKAARIARLAARFLEDVAAVLEE